MKLKYIEFVFENCDCIKIEGKYIGDFLVDNLSTSVKRIACNSIDKVKIANTIVIEIHKDANKGRYQFDQEDIDDFQQMIFDRLTKYNDITSIQFELEETYIEEGQAPCIEHYDYYVDWTGDSEYTNEAQKTYLSKMGNLYLVIADGKKMEDFFDLEKIEDDEYMDFHFRMCNIGDRYINENENREEKKCDVINNIDDKEIVYDFGEAIHFIAERCDLDKSVIETVLDLEEEYMRSIGIIY